MRELIDSHAHYDHKRFDPDRDKLVKSLPGLGVVKIINVGCDMDSSEASIKLAEKYPFVYATVGVHPHDAKSLDEGGFESLKNMLSHKKVVALGEIGLDFYHNFSPPDVQKKWFKRQLALADEFGLPVVIHSRDAHDETMEIIKSSPVRKGVLHSFSGDDKLALQYIEMGFYIGISGVVTFDKAQTTKQTVAATPLSKILLETDCPYLAPVPHRGKRNDSGLLIHIAKVVAEIKNESYETICTETTANVGVLFGV